MQALLKKNCPTCLPQFLHCNTTVMLRMFVDKDRQQSNNDTQGDTSCPLATSRCISKKLASSLHSPSAPDWCKPRPPRRLVHTPPKKSAPYNRSTTARCCPISGPTPSATSTACFRRAPSRHPARLIRYRPATSS